MTVIIDLVKINGKWQVPGAEQPLDRDSHWQQKPPKQIRLRGRGKRDPYADNPRFGQRDDDGGIILF